MPDAASGTELKDGTDAPVAGRVRQLWLFPPPKPLKERFAPEFFRGLPRESGVYFFFDETGRLIYIGKAKNLRQRIGSYRYVHPGRDSRKTWRLVNRIHRIEWETCDSHESALLKESQLLREHRPQFNRANVWPWSSVYIGVKSEGKRIHFTVGRGLDDDHEWYGAFKSFAIYAFSAMRRLIQKNHADPTAPLNCFDWDAGRSFAVDSQSVAVEELQQFLAGASREFLNTFERGADDLGDRALAHQDLVLNDLILLDEFYERGPRRNRQILTDSTRNELVSPEQLVDWLAVQAATREC
ncbi:MAG: GIY-YIG nuclease family protein [Limisphaerales bacterium]